MSDVVIERGYDKTEKQRKPERGKPGEGRAQGEWKSARWNAAAVLPACHCSYYHTVLTEVDDRLQLIEVRCERADRDGDLVCQGLMVDDVELRLIRC